MNETYLAHHGIKGQKWGVRRFRNPDGTLTEAGRKRYSKDLYKTIESTGRTERHKYTYDDTKQVVKQKLDGVFTKDDHDKLSAAYNDYMAKGKKYAESDEKLDEYALKYADEAYRAEMKRNGAAYPTERDKQRLHESCLYDVGYDRARKEHRDLVAAEKQFQKAYDTYIDQCTAVATKITGKYGGYTVKSLSNGDWQTKVDEVVAQAIKSLDHDWHVKENG